MDEGIAVLTLCGDIRAGGKLSGAGRDSDQRECHAWQSSSGSQFRLFVRLPFSFISITLNDIDIIDEAVDQIIDYCLYRML